MTKKTLKPVVFVQGRYAYTHQNTTQQIMLLKALRITQDPNKLRKLIGVQKVADVYRTLDKIAMRKEYHKALTKCGLSFDYVVENVKKEIDSPLGKASDKLKALGMLLKSLGMDKYEETAIGGGGWEEALLAIKQNESDEDRARVKAEVVDYEVITPEMPEELRVAKDKANEEAKGLYD